MLKAKQVADYLFPLTLDEGIPKEDERQQSYWEPSFTSSAEANARAGFNNPLSHRHLFYHLLSFFR